MSQDTLRYDKKIIYKSKDFPIRGKQFVADLAYGREAIIFSEKKMRLEYCYYYDGERNCDGDTYEIINDSLVAVNGTQWHFQKQSNGDYIVWRKDRTVTEYGQVDSLLPFTQKGIFYTVSNQTKDTLWQEEYHSYTKGNPRRKPNFCYYDTKVEGKIYEYDEVTIPPTKLDYTSLNKIELQPEYCFSQPLVDISLVMCIVTKEGNLINIEQALGNLDSSCPDTMKSIMLKIASWGKILPASSNGNSINTRWFITIDNKDRQVLHPLFADTPKNRAKVIKLKKEGRRNE
ncbi:MAG: hypothetical protein AB8G15_19235 [Saprospiraceae bacterium]